jgi:hypothetical protein
MEYKYVILICLKLVYTFNLAMVECKFSEERDRIYFITSQQHLCNYQQSSLILHLWGDTLLLGVP